MFLGCVSVDQGAGCVSIEGEEGILVGSSVGTGKWQDTRLSYLVDPASSHMLVSKIKPCMSKNKPLNGESANGSLNQLLFI